MQEITRLYTFLLGPGAKLPNELSRALQVLYLPTVQNYCSVREDRLARFGQLVDKGGRVYRACDLTHQPRRIREQPHLVAHRLHREKFPSLRQGFVQEGFQSLIKLLGRQCPDAAGVDEEETVGVEGSGTRAKTRGVPLPRELVEARELLPALRVRPAEKGQVAYERLGQIALASVLRDARGAVALGELLAVWTQDQAEADELG